tara:strand:- start:981 stop:1253 length:273 start_codon:yes stop_codon:yes gene_type:complete
MEMKHSKEYYDNLITQYVEGKAKIKGEHPEDVKKAVDMFFHAGKMLVDYPEIGSIPAEYVDNLISALAKHPEYHSLVVDLISILNDERGE